MTDYTGTTGNDTLTGSTGADNFTGDLGNDSLSGLAGNDVIHGDGGNDTLYGGADADYIYGESENDLLDGGAGADTLEGGSGDDTLLGGTENDVLDGGSGNDSMVGGAGDDKYFVGQTGDIVVEALSAGNDTVVAAIDYTLSNDVEVLILDSGIGAHNMKGTGNALNNIIHGNESTSSSGGHNLLMGLAGADTIYGYNGIDTLDGGTGVDSMIGGDDSDTYIVDNVGDVVVELADGGLQDSVKTDLNNYTLGAFVENLTLTGSANLNATGNNLKNTMVGTYGNNLLSAGLGDDLLRGQAPGDSLPGGNDTLDGGVGSDSMYGGTGDDTYYVDTARLLDANDDVLVAGDLVVEGNAQGIDTVITTVNNYALTNDVENLIFGALVLNGTGNGEDNTLTGNTLDNLLKGEAGDDTLIGAAGNDTLDGGLHEDFMQGGAGNDTYYVNALGDVTDETTGSGTDTVLTTATHTLGTGIENLTITSASAINGTGNVLANILTGGNGANNLSGGDGADTINGGAGNDTLNGGAGVDSLTGGAGNDSYLLDSASDVVVEAADSGTDLVSIGATYTLGTNVENLTLTGAGNINGTGNTSANLLTGNTGDNILTAGDGADTLIGGAGNDALNGGTGADSMVGGTGNDVFTVDNAGDIVVETTGQGTQDRVETSVSYVLGLHVENLLLTGSGNIDGTGNASANVLDANAGNNILRGEGGNDTISGFGGNDRLDGGSGNDSLSGGIGNDTYVIDTAGDVIIELAASGTDTVETALAHTLATNFENLTLTGSAGVAGTGNTVANLLTGNSGNNNLKGLDGDDTLIGGAGSDTLNGGTGSDSMDGGAGNDYFIIDAAGDVVVEGAASGTDTIETIFNATLGANFENLMLTGSSNINGNGNGSANIMTGNSGANDLSGFAGNDTLTGGAGNDTLDGGTGNDSMMGGTGDDTYYVDVATDKIIETSTGGTDTAISGTSYVLSSWVENLTLTGTANINGTGNTAVNTLTGNSGNNLLASGSGNDTLSGGAGDDTLNGSTGADSMTGGIGDDVFYFDNAGDIIVEAASGGTDTARTTIAHTLTANVENLVMMGTGTMTGTGNALANTMTGNAGKNTLNGAAGDDILNGMNGADVLTGGTGADHFVFSSITAGNDTINDFNAVEGGAAEGDVLEFAGLLVGTFTYRGALAFTGGSDNSEARYNTTSKLLEIDTNGNGTAEFSLKLVGMDAATEVTALNFLWS